MVQLLAASEFTINQSTLKSSTLLHTENIRNYYNIVLGIQWD